MVKEALVKFDWLKSKGESFEEMVGALLLHMFPDIGFKKTQYVCDGGKDYFSIGTGLEGDIWVEAKNYENHLELSKFSNTFIMADIAIVNRIIVFSMSELTSGAKINVARYAAYHKKHISVYAGADILFLLNHYKSTLDLTLYVKNAEEVLACIAHVVSEKRDDAITVWHDYYQAKQFNLAYRRQAETRITDHLIPCQSLLAQEIHITNPNLFHEKTIHIDYSDYDQSIDPALEVYYFGPRQDTMTLPPASTTVVVIFLKVASPVERIDLPEVHISADNVNNEPHLQTTVDCCWLGEISYMGDGWTKLNDLKQAFDQDPDIHFAVISGKSGVGKTRFLQEVSGVFYQKGYRIISLDFRSLTDLSLKRVLYHILSNIYVAETSQGDDGDTTYIRNGGELYQGFKRILFDDGSYDCVAHMEQFSSQLAALLQAKKIMLLLDNMQDVGADAAAFFEDLLSKLGNQADRFPSAVLCFNEDFLHPQKASEKLRCYLTQLNGCWRTTLTDFSPEDARLYLKECLDPGGHRSDLLVYFEQIIDKFGYNPFALKQFILYLKDRGIIQFSNATTYISNYEELKIVLSELPEGISQLLGCRYQYLLNNANGCSESNIRRVLWSILFFGGLEDSISNAAELDQHCVRLLLSYGFISRDLDLGIVFSHQLIEKYFCLLFMQGERRTIPALTFLPDEPFLERLLAVVETHGKTRFCVESMLLRTHLSKTTNQNIHLALRALTITSPRAIMLPLIWNSLLRCMEMHEGIDPKLEFRAAYALSVASQDRLDVPRAVVLSEPFIRFEQMTYENKTAASEDMILYFKHFTFQLPVERKFAFLDWLAQNAGAFGLAPKKYRRFQGWIDNRYSKNLSAIHHFLDAQAHAKAALNIALENRDLESAAEAEVEYGNCFAYSDPKRTAEHWKKCVCYIDQLEHKSVYFLVCRHAYSMLYKMLIHDLDGLEEHARILQELREQTFLYQKLLIDDVCADYDLLRYIEAQEEDTGILEALIPRLTKMKAESYLHTPIFTMLATYKLFTVYRLLHARKAEKNDQVASMSLIYELIENGIFEREKLPYSKMILADVAEYTHADDSLVKAVYSRLPFPATKEYTTLLSAAGKRRDGRATTVLSDSRRRINLLHFNYVF